jgi:hypothetical protein
MRRDRFEASFFNLLSLLNSFVSSYETKSVDRQERVGGDYAFWRLFSELKQRVEYLANDAGDGSRQARASRINTQGHM